MRNIILTMLLLATIHVARAQVLSGEQPDAGHGFGFTIPAGWAGAMGSDGYLMQNEGVPGMILIAPKRFADQDEVVRTFSESTNDGQTILSPTEAPSVDADGTVRVEQTGTMQGNAVKVLVRARLNPYGGNTANVMAIAPHEHFGPALEEALGRILASIRYTKPSGQGASTAKLPEDDQWKARLSGTRLTRLESYNSPSSTEGGIGGGYSSEQRIDLCPEGHFKTTSSSGYVIGGAHASGYGSGSNAGSGTWRVLRGIGGMATLRLQYHDGTVVEHRLGWEDGKTFLDGDRWFRTSLAQDGPDYAPDCP